MPTRRTMLTLAAGGVASLVLPPRSRAADFWTIKDSSKWTPEEIHILLSNSPWAKQVKARYKIEAADKPETAPWSERPVGMPGGLNHPRLSTSGPESDFTGTIRWESSRPIREALKDSLPAPFANHYVISVSGLPAPTEKNLEKLKGLASLTKKPDGFAGAAFIQQRNAPNAAFLFAFAKDSLVLTASGEVEFTAALDPLVVSVKFPLKPMRYRGELAL
jgi:hypothetical protein